MIKKISAVLLSASILTACGGGGDSSPSAPPELIKMASQVISVNENESGSLSFSTDASDIAFEINDMSPSNIGSITLNGNILEISTLETDRPGRISGVLYSKEKGKSHSSAKDISVIVINTSAMSIENKASHIKTQSDDLLSLKEDYAIFQLILEASYLNSLIDYNEKSSLLSGFAPEESSGYGSLKVEIGDLISGLSSYEKGAISDTELQALISDFDTALISHGNYASQKLSEIQIYSDPYLADLTQTQFVYNSGSGKYSRYVGQSEMGSYANGAWVFDESYDLLSSLVTTKLSDPILVCEA